VARRWRSPPPWSFRGAADRRSRALVVADVDAAAGPDAAGLLDEGAAPPPRATPDASPPVAVDPPRAPADPDAPPGAEPDPPPVALGVRTAGTPGAAGALGACTAGVCGACTGGTSGTCTGGALGACTGGTPGTCTGGALGACTGGSEGAGTAGAAGTAGNDATLTSCVPGRSPPSAPVTTGTSTATLATAASNSTLRDVLKARTTSGAAARAARERKKPLLWLSTRPAGR
jgi:hypothetical protein